MPFTAVKAIWDLTAFQIAETGRRAEVFARAHHMALIWSLGIAYKFILDAMYLWAASLQYAYAGLVLQTGSVKYILASVMYVILFAFLPKQENKIAPFLLHLQFAFTVAPMLCFYALSDGSTKYMLMVFVCILLQTWIVRGSPSESRPICITGIRNYVTVALGVLTIFISIIPILYNGFAGLKAFDLSYIYTMRENAVYPPGFGYLLNWAPKVILPFGCLMSLQHRRYRLFVLCVALQLLLYMETGQKITLLILLPVIAVYLFAKTGHLIKLLYAGLGIFFLGIVILYQLDRTSGGLLGIYLNAFIAIRAVFHPADNKFNYYEYFSSHPKVYFSDGFFGKMFSLTNPYAGSIGQVSYAAIGGEFMKAEMNTGYLGESYAQMGFAGMVLMAVLLALIIRGLQAYNRRETFGILAGLFSVFMIVLNDIALFTTLLTGGMLLAFLLVFIYLGKQRKEAEDGIQRL